MFKSSILNTTYEDSDHLLRAIADNLVYAYGVVDYLGDNQISAIVTQKSTESDGVTTALVPSPSIKNVSNLILPDGYVIMVTGRVAGSPALAYISNNWLGSTNINATIAGNLDTLATAMGYDAWFIAPHLTAAQGFVPGNPYYVSYQVGLSGSSSPYTLSVATTEHNLPAFVLDVPSDPPHGADASWWKPEDYDRLIDYLRSNTFETVKRYYGQDSKQHVDLPQRHYITDLENVQDVLRQVSSATISDVESVSSDVSSEAEARASAVTDEATARIAADNALRGVIGDVAVFGNTFKQVVNSDKSLDQYIPRP